MGGAAQGPRAAVGYSYHLLLCWHISLVAPDLPRHGAPEEPP